MPLIVSLEALGEPGTAAQAEGTSAWWRCPRALQMPAPRPQHRGGDGTGRQTGITLGSDKGSHSLVGFLLELPEEGKREVRRDPGDAPHPRDSRPQHLTQNLYQGSLCEQVNGHVFTQKVPE